MSSATRPSRPSCLVVALIAGGIGLLLLAIVLVTFLGLRQVFVEQEATPGVPLEVVKVTPTPAIFPSPSPSTSPLPPPSCQTIISSGDVEVAVSLPVSLTVGGRDFPVVAIVPGDEGWAYPDGYPGAAAWLCGSVVNYVVGLEPLPENGTLLTGLRPGDEIELHLSNGVTLNFRFSERREVAPNDQGIFEQARPRLTLILEGTDAWQVAIADYVSETEPVQPPTGEPVAIGQPVRVGDVQVTVTSGYVVRDAPDLLPGTLYYLVEFAVENFGTAPVDTTVFDMRLVDGDGNEYLLSPAASDAGKSGPLTGLLQPGGEAKGSAGYLVPESLNGPTLIWVFSPRPGAELQARFSLPYEPPAEEPTGAGHAEVAITDAFLSEGGTVLVIEGEVRNTGDAPVTVALTDISLTSSAGMSSLRMAAPPLPWTIAPGDTQTIELQYDKPDAATALLSLLGYSIEIRGF